MRRYLVFDWGGTYFKYAVMDEETNVLEKSKVPSPPGTSDQEHLYALIDQIVETYREEIEGIAVSMPGMLDERTGFARTAGSLKFLIGAAVGSELMKRYQLPVSVQNDGKAAVLAEHWKGNLQGCSNCAVIIIGTGIGGGIILNDRLLVGKDFSAGEFSFVSVNEKCPDTREGYWCHHGHSDLSRLVAARTGEDPASIDGIEVFRRVRKGEEAAIEALKEFTFYYAQQIHNLSILLDLEKIAIGGGISEDPLLLEYLHESIARFRSRLPFNRENAFLPMAEVVECRFHNDANLIGALYHHLYGEWEKAWKY